MNFAATTEENAMIGIFGLALSALIFIPADSAREITITRINDNLTATYANGTTTTVTKIRLGKPIKNQSTGLTYATGAVLGPDINCNGTFVLDA